MGFREIKLKSRRDLHNKLKVPALYYPGGGNPNGFVPTPIYVRAHNNNTDVGGQAGTSLGYAEVRDDAPRVIFDILQVADPSRLDVVMVSATEGYRVDHEDPIDGEFQVTVCTRLSTTELAGFSAP